VNLVCLIEENLFAFVISILRADWTLINHFS
jgi:surfactin synthase thioesterase subunit